MCRGARLVKKEANLCVWQLRPYHAWHQEQMIVMNPDYITFAIAGHHLVCKSLVDILVELPTVVCVSFALWMIRYLIVKDWPENRFAEVAVMAIEIPVSDVDNFGIVLIQHVIVYFVANAIRQ